MKKVPFGKTGMEITRVGFGAWAIGGGGWDYAWGPQDDALSIETIHAALDAGINWIDTAAVYGLGHSEEIVARALDGINERPYVFTKCSLVWDENGKISSNLDPDSIRKEVEDSLRRLNVDVLDLYQIHWPTPKKDIEQGWQTLVALQQEGKLRHIGVSNFKAEQLAAIGVHGTVETLQPPYYMLDRRIEAEILPYCEANNIGVIVYSPMANGLLTGAFTKERVENFPDDDWRRNNPNFQEPRFSKNLELVEILKEIAAAHNVPTPTIAVAWTLQHSAVTAAIVGARRPDQIAGWIQAGDITLSDEELTRIKAKLTDIDEMFKDE